MLISYVLGCYTSNLHSIRKRIHYYSFNLPFYIINNSNRFSFGHESLTIHARWSSSMPRQSMAALGQLYMNTSREPHTAAVSCLLDASHFVFILKLFCIRRWSPENFQFSCALIVGPPTGWATNDRKVNFAMHIRGIPLSVTLQHCSCAIGWRSCCLSVRLSVVFARDKSKRPRITVEVEYMNKCMQYIIVCGTIFCPLLAALSYPVVCRCTATSRIHLRNEDEFKFMCFLLFRQRRHTFQNHNMSNLHKLWRHFCECGRVCMCTEYMNELNLMRACNEK